MSQFPAFLNSSDQCSVNSGQFSAAGWKQCFPPGRFAMDTEVKEIAEKYKGIVQEAGKELRIRGASFVAA